MAEQTAETAYASAVRVSFPPWEAFLHPFRAALDQYLKASRLVVPEALYVTMLGVAVDIYEHELLAPLPKIGSGHPQANRTHYQYRSTLGADKEKTLANLTRAVLHAFLYFLKSLPPLSDAPQPFTLPASKLLDYPAVYQTLRSFFPSSTLMFGLLENVYDRAGYTPLRSLFEAHVPYGILPDEERFQHSWIVAPSGTGKTTLLENLIYCDLERVAKNEASVFIMDSQNELIPRLTAMSEFHDGPLKGKLIVLEPSADFPLALNIFDNQLDDIDRFSAEDRENLYASSLEMADFVMSGLLGADLTAKQKGIFRYVTQALQVIPDATIHTFADLLSEGGYQRYARYIRTLDPYTVQFFETRFSSSTFRATKEEIFWRLDTIMSNTTFRKMFSHPKNKFNLYDELQSAKVICVNTKLGLLKKEGTEIFGRYFLAMLLQATERRMLIDRSKRLPTFCYIDECHDYIAEEPKMASLLDKARKQKVGFTLAHQRLANIKNLDVLDALGNVRMKIASRNQTDAPYLSKLFRTTPEFLSQAPQYSFAINVGGPTLMAACPPSPFSEGATAAQLAIFRNDMRDRFCAPPYVPPPEHDGPTIDGEVVDPIRNGDVGAKGRQRGLPKPADDSDAATDW